MDVIDMASIGSDDDGAPSAVELVEAPRVRRQVRRTPALSLRGVIRAVIATPDPAGLAGKRAGRAHGVCNILVERSTCKAAPS